MRRILLPAVIDDRPPPRGALLQTYGGATMGTSWSVRLYASPMPALQQAIEARLAELMAQMSHWAPDSELGRFNRAPAGSWHSLSPEFFSVLSFALGVASDSGGAFDPCAGALVNAWGFGPGERYDAPGFAVPDAAQIEQARAKGNWQALELDRSRMQARQPGGLQLDLSGVAKGYAVDQVAQLLAQHGVAHYLVEIGGELRGAGIKDDRQPWWVALERLDDVAQLSTAQLSTESAPQESEQESEQEAEILVALHGLAIASSGDYLRYFETDGRRYPHTIDPRHGRPLANGVALASVIDASCMSADAWATALTVLGVDDGLRLAQARGLAVRWLRRTEDGVQETMSSAMLALQ